MKTLSVFLLRVLPLIIISLAAFYGAQYFWGTNDTPSPPDAQQALKSLGDTATDFSLYTFADRNKSFALASLRGEPVILNFWATWCSPCIQELPGLIEIAKKFKPLGLRVVAVSEDKDWRAVDLFFTRYPKLAAAKDEFLILLDPQGEVAGRYGAAQIPESYLINRDFRIVLRLSGEQAWQDPRYGVYYDRILKK